MMLGNIKQRLDDQDLFLTANDMVLYGTLNNHKIGYFNILGMAGYSNNENFEPNEEVIARVLDNLVDEFADCKAIIVDVRLNNGGEDLVSFEIASRFNDQVRVGYSRQYRNGGYDEYSELVQTYTQLDEKNFGNKTVVLLTSNHTLSAADVFAMIMKDIPTVTLLGEHTYGIFSDVLGKKLPNGWEFSLSNERYFSSEGINYEQIGIYPDIELALDSVGFFNGTDNILEKAVELVSQSDVETISLKSLSLRAFPNPGGTNKVIIEVALPEDQHGELRIIDMAGNVVTIYNVHGTETINWNSEGYSEGLYLAVLNNGFSSESIKITKLK
jgi:C-terminal processing protease CtpA/Prc